ncbi:MAG: PhzF family phenazine biosynthesis protein [Bradyrhizobium sp.]
MFGWDDDDLDSRIPPAIVSAGADHLLLALKSRETLSAMRYDQNAGKVIMEAEMLATISLVFSEGPQRFHARNPFAAGGVYEDPATGAAAASAGRIPGEDRLAARSTFYRFARRGYGDSLPDRCRSGRRWAEGRLRRGRGPRYSVSRLLLPMSRHG